MRLTLRFFLATKQTSSLASLAEYVIPVIAFANPGSILRSQPLLDDVIQVTEHGEGGGDVARHQIMEAPSDASVLIGRRGEHGLVPP